MPNRPRPSKPHAIARSAALDHCCDRIAQERTDDNFRTTASGQDNEKIRFQCPDSSFFWRDWLQTATGGVTSWSRDTMEHNASNIYRQDKTTHPIATQYTRESI